MSSDTKLTKDNELSAFVPASKRLPKPHLEVVKRIFRYIKGTTHLGLWYPKGTDIETVVYADSDHAGDYVDRKSTSGICTFVGCCLTSWFSKKQTALAISTTKAEYVSAGKACQQALWMKQALIDYDIRLDDVPIMCDNKGVIDLSKNPVQHSRTKHIEIRHYFLRDNKFRNVFNSMGKGNKGLGGMNEDESDGGESRDEGANGEMTSNAFSDTKSLDSRSYGNSTSKGVNMNNSINTSDEIGLIPVPVNENLLLSSKNNPVGSPRILKRGESLVDRGSKSNAPFSFNTVEKWPSLSETCGIKVNGVNDISEIRDEAMKEVSVGMKHVSFINVVQGVNKSGSNKLRLIPVCMNDQGKRVMDMDPFIKKGSKNWSMTLVGYFVGLKMSHKEILGHLRRMWRAYQLDEVIMNDCGLYFLKFKSDEDSISRITSMIGSPIIMDRITTKMCDRSYGRASFVRVLIKVDADLGLSDKIEVWYKSLGRSMELRVEYPWKPPVCSHCKVFM
ncbi:hypothetical protein Tco_0086585 [Tanacetum coccineum]